MTRQIEHSSKLGIGETPSEPRPHKIDILKAILPEIAGRTGGWNSVICPAALRQVKHRILKSPQTGQRGRHNTGNLGGVSAAHLARQRRALDAQTMRRMHGRVIPPCTLQLMAGGFQQQALAAQLAPADACECRRQIRKLGYRAAGRPRRRMAHRPCLEAENPLNSLGFQGVLTVERGQQEVTGRREMEVVVDQRPTISRRVVPESGRAAANLRP